MQCVDWADFFRSQSASRCLHGRSCTVKTDFVYSFEKEWQIFLLLQSPVISPPQMY